MLRHRIQSLLETARSGCELGASSQKYVPIKLKKGWTIVDKYKKILIPDMRQPDLFWKEDDEGNFILKKNPIILVIKTALLRGHLINDGAGEETMSYFGKVPSNAFDTFATYM